MMHQLYPGASLSPSPRQGHVLMISDKKFVAHNDSPVTFTVWKKSLVFNGSGYTVFDSSGNLVFRVDNYAYDARHQLFLMDTAGNVLLTLLHKERMMHQVYPGASLSPSPRQAHVLMIGDKKFVAHNDSPVTFTVWKKSLVFDGSGYTVFDSSGNLVFRVDNYAYDPRHQLFLMDTAGNVLLTLLHKQRLSFNDRWEAYRGDGYGSGIKPVFSVLKSALTLFSSKPSAKVVLNPTKRRNTNLYDFEIEGSLCNPSSSFTVFGSSRQIIAQAKRKVAKPEIMLGEDVLSLVVQPGVDQAFVMGLLIVFNQIFSR